MLPIPRTINVIILNDPMHPENEDKVGRITLSRQTHEKLNDIIKQHADEIILSEYEIKSWLDGELLVDAMR